MTWYFIIIDKATNIWIKLAKNMMPTNRNPVHQKGSIKIKDFLTPTAVDNLNKKACPT